MIIYSASEVGKCARGVVGRILDERAGIEYEEPEYLRIASREGDRHEPFIRQDLYEEWGWISMGDVGVCKICYAARNTTRAGMHISIPDPKGMYEIIGHSDDILQKGDDIRLGEYKALGENQYKMLTDSKFGGIARHRKYAMQVSIYANFFGLRILYAIKNRNTGRMAVREYDKPFYTMDEIHARLDVLTKYILKGTIPPCDKARGDNDTYACPQECKRRRYG